MLVLWSVCEILQLQCTVPTGRRGRGAAGSFGRVGPIPLEDPRETRIRVGAGPGQGGRELPWTTKCL